MKYEIRMGDAVFVADLPKQEVEAFQALQKQAANGDTKAKAAAGRLGSRLINKRSERQEQYRRIVNS
jgi:hypothetical protein